MYVYFCMYVCTYRNTTLHTHFTSFRSCCYLFLTIAECMYLYVCMYICKYIWMYQHINLHIFPWPLLNVCMCISVCPYASISECIDTSIYLIILCSILPSLNIDVAFWLDRLILGFRGSPPWRHVMCRIRYAFLMTLVFKLADIGCLVWLSLETLFSYSTFLNRPFSQLLDTLKGKVQWMPHGEVFQKTLRILMQKPQIDPASPNSKSSTL